MNKKRPLFDFVLFVGLRRFTVESLCASIYERWKIEISPLDAFAYIYEMERDGYIERLEGAPLTWKNHKE